MSERVSDRVLADNLTYWRNLRGGGAYTYSFSAPIALAEEVEQRRAQDGAQAELKEAAEFATEFENILPGYSSEYDDVKEWYEQQGN